MLWALAATLVSGAVVALAGPSADGDLPRLFENTAVALQAARNSEEVAMIVGEPQGPNWRAIRLQTRLDFFLALSYAWAFAMMGRALRRRGGRASSFLGTCVMIGGVAAGLFDATENFLILQVVHNSVTFSPWIARFADLKWACLGVATLAVTKFWFPSLPLVDERKAFGAFAAFLYLNAGALAIAGVFWPLAWERFGLPFTGALLVSLGLVLIPPPKAVRPSARALVV